MLSRHSHSATSLGLSSSASRIVISKLPNYRIQQQVVLGRRLQSSNSSPSSSSDTSTARASWLCKYRLLYYLPYTILFSLPLFNCHPILMYRITARLRTRLRATPTKWTPLPIAGGVALLVALNFYKKSDLPEHLRDGTYDSTEDNDPKVRGPWQVGACLFPS